MDRYNIYVTELDCLTVRHLVNGGRNSVTGSKGVKTKLWPIQCYIENDVWDRLLRFLTKLADSRPSW